MPQPVTLNVLIVDDSFTYRQIMARVVGEIPGAKLVGQAKDGVEALRMVDELKPDLVLLDVTMPKLDGLETLRKLKRQHPKIDAIMVSGVNADQARSTMEALSMGALDFVTKPDSHSSTDSLTTLTRELTPLFILARKNKRMRLVREEGPAPEAKPAAPVREKPQTTARPVAPPAPSRPIQRPRPQPKAAPAPVAKPKPARRVVSEMTFDVVALGVSTGGPQALQELVPRLSPNFPLPILAVQHMPPVFTATLAEKLNRDSKITVVEGEDGMPVKPGTMYIAQGARHMIVRGTVGFPRLEIIDTPPIKSCKPSVEVLFESVFKLYGKNVLTVMLTGMGNDGADGTEKIRDAGGYSLVQDEASSVVWGMPGAVAQRDAADEILPLKKIVERMEKLVRK